MATLLCSSGHLIDPLDIDFSKIGMRQFVHGMAQLNRYTGNTLFPFSVACHTRHLSYVVPWHLKRAAIIHDFNEVLTADLPNPVKCEMPEYRVYEEKVQRQIALRYRVPWSAMEELKEYDRRICADEMLQLFDPPWIMGHGYEPFGTVKIKETDWRKSKALLIDRCISLGIV